MTSAERRFAAASKDSLVRVDASKKSVATVFPRSAGTLGIGRPATSRNESAVRMMSTIPSRPRSFTDKRWRVFIGPSSSHPLARR